MEELPDTLEIIGYRCGDCSGEDWKITIGYRSDGRILLIVTCANADCVERKRREVGAKPEELMIWGEYDITEQWEEEGEGDICSCKEIN